MTLSDSSRNIAYVLSSFPVLNEYFYYLEVEGLRQLGWNVHIFTLLERDATGTEEWNLPEGYLHRQSFLSWRLWQRVLGQCVRHPLVLFGFLVLFSRRLYSKPTQLAKTLAATVKALSYVPIIQELDIRIIHGAWGQYPGVIAFVMHKMCPKAVFTIALGAYDYESHFALIPDMVEASKLVFVISEERKRQVIEEWPRTQRPVVCVYRGVQLVTDHNEHGVRRGIITVGQLASYKGLHVLIEALSTLRARGIDFQARFVGGSSSSDPSYSGKLERQVVRLGLADQIEFTGPLPHDQVLRAIDTAELFVLPSLFSDQLPNAVKEALSLRVPVIVTPTVGIDELVQNKKSGLIVPKDDPVALADAIAWALQNPEQMQQMALRGHSTLADKFDINKTSAQRSGCYEQILTQPMRSEVAHDLAPRGSQGVGLRSLPD
jgi:glycosyltransferase involved in cell wall biosynthesis